MKNTFNEISNKLKSFAEGDEDACFGSAIRDLYYALTNANPQIPDVVYTLEELQSYSNKLQVAEGDDIQKYYQLSIQHLSKLEHKAEQAGII